jgi:hypothetical protein
MAWRCCLACPGLFFLVRNLTYLACSSTAWATIESEPHLASGGPSYGTSVVSFDVSFPLPDGTRQRGLVTWITRAGVHELRNLQGSKNLQIRYNRRKPSEILLPGAGGTDLLGPLLMLAVAIGLVLLFR